VTAMASLLARAEEKEGERAVFALPRGGGPPRRGATGEWGDRGIQGVLHVSL